MQDASVDGLAFAGIVILAALLIDRGNLLRCNQGPRVGVWRLAPGRRRRQRKLRFALAVLFGVLCSWLVYSRGHRARVWQSPMQGEALVMEAQR